MAKKIVLFNNKGGVGKTTFLYHLGYALEKEGKRILFVDLDPQCNLTSNMLKDEEIQKIWDEKKSIFKSVEPSIKGTGDIATADPVKMKDKWTFGQFATFIPPTDFEKLVKLAKEYRMF